MTAPRSVEDLRAARRVAFGIDLLAVGASLAANVATAQRSPAGVLVAATAPVGLFVAILLWHRSEGLLTGWLGRTFDVCLAGIAIGAAWISFDHVRELSLSAGQSEIAASIIPLVIDGVAVLSTLVVVAAGQAIAAADATAQAEAETERRAERERIAAERRAVQERREAQARVAELTADRRQAGGSSSSTNGATKPGRRGGKRSAVSAEDVAAYFVANPDATHSQAAEALGCSTKHIQRNKPRRGEEVISMTTRTLVGTPDRPDDDHNPQRGDDGRFTVPADAEATGSSRAGADVIRLHLDQGDVGYDVDDTTEWQWASSTAEVDEFADEALFEPARSVHLVDGVPVGEPAQPVQRERSPVLPGWLSTGAGRTGAVTGALLEARHFVTFHGVRIPWYLVRPIGRTPVGIWRVAKFVAHWVGDHGSDDDRARMAEVVAANHNAGIAMTLHDADLQHRRAMRTRALLVLAALPLVGWLIWLRVSDWQPWQQLLAGWALLFVLGLIGRDRTTGGERSVARYHGSRPTKPTAEVITFALRHLGIGALTKAIEADPDTAIRFTGPAHREGTGWRIDFDLPPGVTAAEVIDRRSKLAAALQRPVGCVWPTALAEIHEGRLSLFVADKALGRSGAIPWELAERGETNVFEPLPLGSDPKGQPVTIVLMFAAGVIGAIPRMGKTFTLRLLLLAAALDARCELHIFNLKGGPDLKCFADGLARTYRSGDRPDDLEAARLACTALQDEMRRRYDVLDELPADICPEGKITDALASRKDLGLHPIVAAVDECQLWFESSIPVQTASGSKKSQTYGDVLSGLAEDLVRRGPAVGVMCWFSTQRPDASSLPTPIRDNAALRIAMRVTSQPANDQILGTSAYKEGVRATQFNRSDHGLAILTGEGDDPVIVKTAFVDGADALKIAGRALAVREAKGWHREPDPELVDVDDRSLLDDLVDIWPDDMDRLHWIELAPMLIDAFPDVYPDSDVAQVAQSVSRQARTFGIPTTDFRSRLDGQARKGMTGQSLRRALDQRMDSQPVDHDGANPDAEPLR